MLSSPHQPIKTLPGKNGNPKQISRIAVQFACFRMFPLLTVDNFAPHYSVFHFLSHVFRIGPALEDEFWDVVRKGEQTASQRQEQVTPSMSALFQSSTTQLMNLPNKVRQLKILIPKISQLVYPPVLHLSDTTVLIYLLQIINCTLNFTAGFPLLSLKSTFDPSHVARHRSMFEFVGQSRGSSHGGAK